MKRWSRAELRRHCISKPTTEVGSKAEPFPLAVDKIMVISIREPRWHQFQKRFGSWQAEHWSGTLGTNISRSRWYRQGLAQSRHYLSRGQLGCFHSHVRLWREMVRKKWKRVLICEDDAGIYQNKTTREYLQKLQRQVRRVQYDLLMLGHHNRKPRGRNTKCIHGHIEEAPDGIGLFAYVLTLNGARKLLGTKIKPYRVPVDHFISQCIRKKKLRVLRVRPALCFVVPVTSDTIGIK